MPDKNKDNSQSKGGQQRDKQKPLKDLETRKADMDKVKGGRAAVFSSDPCEGGE